MKPTPESLTQEVLAGLVERVTFHNAENGFCVLRAKARGHRDLVTVVGHAAIISAGEWITASGEWINDRAHGQQFKARFLKTSAPSSIDGIEKYLGSEVLRKRALNCWPWARVLIHSPEAVIHSPAEMTAAWPTTVTRSRCPRAFALRTQKPFSELWKVTRSTRPASTSCVEDSGFDFIRTAGSFFSGKMPRTLRQPCHYERWTRETETESTGCWMVSRGR